MSGTGNANDEYESIPLREGEYLVHPDPRIASVHKWISKIEEEAPTSGDHVI